MGQNEKQTIKAIEKINLIDNLITSYEKINELEEANNMKPYIVTLDYEENKNFTKFYICIKKDKHINCEDIFDITFSLKSKEDGLKLFQKLREKYVKRDSIQYSGFTTEHGNIIDHFIKKNSNIKLKTNIHNSEDLQNLKEYNQIINNSKVFGYKGFSHSCKTKDELQLIKASAKANIIYDIMVTLSNLNELEENYNNMKYYVFKINKNIYNDSNGEKYYKFNIELTKNSIYQNKKILSLNFSIKNDKLGWEIIEQIIKSFSQTTKMLPARFDDGTSIIQNNSKIKIMTTLQTEFEKEKFKNIHTYIFNNLNNSKIKKIEKK